MPIKDVLQLGNDFLRTKADPVNFEIDPIDQYIADLSDTLRKYQNDKKIGRAMAGPQIGYQKRIIRMETGNRSMTMINPTIIRKSSETFEVWDSCFSADVAFFGKTIRFNSIEVVFFDELNNERHEEFSGELSELFQHEIDHLYGILFTDHLISNQIIMRSEWEKL